MTPRPKRKQALDAPKPPVEAVRDCADALFRAATECCHQAERMSRVSAKSAVEDEQEAASQLCTDCNDTLRRLTDAYERASAQVHPRGADAAWWHAANTLWLASREFLRRNGAAHEASQELKDRSPERLNELQSEYELEASAALALRQAAEGYRQHRPTAF